MCSSVATTASLCTPQFTRCTQPSATLKATHMRNMKVDASSRAFALSTTRRKRASRRSITWTSGNCQVPDLSATSYDR